MKKIIFLFTALYIGYLANAQTVENIRVEPEGDNIKINYRIGGSTEAQLYNVFITCSMDGGPRFEPKTVIGDVGENIRGGRAYYTVIWDVFEDVTEVNNAEFFVKVELVSDMSSKTRQPQYQQPIQQPFQPVPEKETQTSPTYQDYSHVGAQKKQFDKRVYLAYTASTQSLIGLSLGTVKKFGGYGSARMGYYITDWDGNIWVTLVAGMTKYFVESGKYRMHGYIGIGTTVEYYEDYVYEYNWNDSYFTLDFGFINIYGGICLNFGFEFVNFTDEVSDKLYPVFGLGFVF